MLFQLHVAAHISGWRFLEHILLATSVGMTLKWKSKWPTSVAAEGEDLKSAQAGGGSAHHFLGRPLPTEYYSAATAKCVERELLVP
jgi:hypothetical protein